MRKKFIMVMMVCLCMVATLLSGCGNNTDKTEERLQAADNAFHEEIQKAEPDELTVLANQAIDGYQGDGNDMEYIRVKAIAVAEETRQECLIEIVSSEMKIESAEKVIRFCEKFGDQELKKQYQEIKDSSEESKKEMVKILKDAMDIEEKLLERGEVKSETKSTTKSELML